MEQNTCLKCQGKTIIFRGQGLNMEWMLCPDFMKPGHKSIDECNEELIKIRKQVRPSGRLA